MPRCAIESLACWWDRFDHHHNVNIQNAIPTSYVVDMEREMFKASRGVKKQFWI